MLPSVLDHYQVEMENGMLSKYQYMLQMPASMAGGDSKLEQMVIHDDVQSGSRNRKSGCRKIQRLFTEHPSWKI